MNRSSIILLITLLLGGYQYHRMGCTLWDARPKSNSLDQTPILSNNDPIQTELVPEEIGRTINKKIDGKPILISPVAHYKIAGRVVSKRHYYGDYKAKLSPVDLALAWGPISTPKYDSEISFSHSDRRYHYSYDTRTLSLAPSDIAWNSANEHLIPANRNIELVLKSIGQQEIVELEGYLVNVDAGTPDDGYFNWTSSLTRKDTGDGACELMYVTKVRIGSESFR